PLQPHTGQHRPTAAARGPAHRRGAPRLGDRPRTCRGAEGVRRHRLIAALGSGASLRAVPTLVCFHAHPDDEVLTTGGTMAAASRAGHRVVLVVATGGEEGEPVPGVLDEGESLEERRALEVQRSADILGVHAVYFLGYRDSGMMGEESNDRADAFWKAPVDEAAEQLAVILRSEGCDVLTVYDDHGNYGHPDHVQVHRVGHAAARLAGVEVVYEATMNRDHV